MRHLTLSAPAPGLAPAPYSFTARGLPSGYHSDGTAATPSASPPRGRASAAVAAASRRAPSLEGVRAAQRKAEAGAAAPASAALAVVPLRPALFTRYGSAFRTRRVRGSPPPAGPGRAAPPAGQGGSCEGRPPGPPGERALCRSGSHPEVGGAVARVLS